MLLYLIAVILSLFLQLLMPIERWTGQIIITCLLLLTIILNYRKFIFFKISRSLVISLVIVVFTTSSFSYLIKKLPNKNYISILANDPTGADSRRFFQSLKKNANFNLTPLSLKLGDKILTEAKATEILINNREIDRVVWGKRRWLTISQQLTPDLVLTAGSPIKGLKLITSIRSFSLSVPNGIETLHFIVRILELPLTVLADLTNRTIDKAELSLIIVKLKSIGSLRSTWTASSHLAYPWWQVGNILLYDALIEKLSNQKQLQCAIKAYEESLSLVRLNNNPKLAIAIKNNLLVAEAINMSVFGKTKGLKNLIKSFVEINNLKVKVGSAPIENIKALNSFILANKRGRKL
jgi:hypothetical protein